MPERVFPLPDLGEGLEEAVVSAWLVAEGDTVELNQPFVEIETAKATVEVPAPFAGTISKLHVGAGETLAVGAPLATFEVAGSVGAAAVATTPAVRKLAKDLGVDLSDVAGSGPDGRITRADVERLADSGRETEGGGRSTTVPLSPTRRAIAARLTEVAAIPQVTTFRTIDCSALETHCERTSAFRLCRSSSGRSPRCAESTRSSTRAGTANGSSCSTRSGSGSPRTPNAD